MSTKESEAGASKPETLIKQFRRPAQGQSPVPFSLRHAGRTALCPEMSVAPAAVHNPSGLAEFGGWDQYSVDFVMSTRRGAEFSD